MAEAISTLISDTQSQVVQTCWAVIYTPQTRRRKRFENCVTVYPCEADARATARPKQGYYAAVAHGPSRSSEGFRLFYLVRWLD